MTQPTNAELLVLRAIRSHIRQHKIAPTYEQIAEYVGREKSTIRHRLKALIEKGLLVRGPEKNRNLILTEAGITAAKDGRKTRGAR